MSDVSNYLLQNITIGIQLSTETYVNAAPVLQALYRIAEF